MLQITSPTLGMLETTNQIALHKRLYLSHAHVPKQRGGLLPQLHKLGRRPTGEQDLLQPVGRCINNISRITSSKHSSRQQARYVLLSRSRHGLETSWTPFCFLAATWERVQTNMLRKKRTRSILTKRRSGRLRAGGVVVVLSSGSSSSSK